MRYVWIMLAATLATVDASAAEVAVVQQAARTTAGTQDFTSSGFGTPKAAMCLVSYGATNGTAVSHAGLSVGFTDGTRQHAMSVRSKHGVTTTVTGRRADTTDLLVLADPDGAVILRVQFSAWITNGLRVNYSVAPSTAYQVSCTLFGGAGITNAYVNTVTTPSTVDLSTTVSTVGFQPDVVIGAVNGDGSYNDTNQSQGDLSIGYAINGATQKAHSWSDVTGLGTTSVLARNLSNRIGRSGINSQQVELQNFTSSGFDATTRGSSFSATLGYLALKLSGIAATGLAIDSPTATGSRSITGINGIPQWGLLVSGAVGSVDTTTIDGNAEAFGLSTFTSAAQSCVAIASDDAVTTTATESMVDSKPVCLRKDAGLFYSASFTSFSSGTATFNYATANGTARKWIGLFLSAPASGSGAARRRVF